MLLTTSKQSQRMRARSATIVDIEGHAATVELVTRGQAASFQIKATELMHTVVRK